MPHSHNIGYYIGHMDDESLADALADFEDPLEAVPWTSYPPLTTWMTNSPKTISEWTSTIIDRPPRAKNSIYGRMRFELHPAVVVLVGCMGQPTSCIRRAG